MVREDSVCWVNEQGQVECSGSSFGTSDARTRNALAGVHAAFPELGANGIELIARFIELVNAAKIDDKCIGWRAPEIQESVALLLRERPPAMLLYHFSTLPANVLATYYLHVGQPVNAAYITRQYETTKPACKPAAH